MALVKYDLQTNAVRQAFAKRLHNGPGLNGPSVNAARWLHAYRHRDPGASVNQGQIGWGLGHGFAHLGDIANQDHLPIRPGLHSGAPHLLQGVELALHFHQQVIAVAAQLARRHLGIRAPNGV